MGPNRPERASIEWGAQPRVADVVLVYRNGLLQAHRVLFRWKGRYVTAGDRTRRFDPGCHAGAVLGRIHWAGPRWTAYLQVIASILVGGLRRALGS